MKIFTVSNVGVLIEQSNQGVSGGDVVARTRVIRDSAVLAAKPETRRLPRTKEVLQDIQIYINN
jgi:hypothetical protein